jgi:hypothetical protein
MKRQRTTLTISLAIAAVTFAACGGAENSPREPQSMATTPSSADPASAENNARVSTGTVTASPAASSSSPPSQAPPAPVTSPSQSPYPPLPAGPCDSCNGMVTTDLQAALTKRAQDSRNCYVRLLTNNPNARASMTIEVRVGRDGTSCEANAHVDPPEWPELTTCVVQEFRKNNLPLPGKGSCVIARVPILFTPAP